ncbi:MAG TPA: 2-oxoglutarate dehydrogenase complex dihydrolipoyllysine-residue succinyltransferase, partial [Planctomycetaceae bacterium]|nr:2-oxoglutarate dehydrogenase complex dihydrolipoyllysine-residue succinyltransferase [Planctomycetaceae bacterium]
MPVEVVVPPVGESISEVMIGEWKKKVGEKVALDEALVEYESEKATQDIPAPSAGVLTKILKVLGDTAAVGEVIAEIDPTAVPTITTEAPAAPSGKDNGPVEPRVMPAAQRLAAESGVSTAQVSPTGPGGRVLKEDVQRAATVAKAAPVAPPAAKPTPGPVSVMPATVARPTGDRAIRRQAMSPIRRTIASRLVEAQHTAALLTTFNECDMSGIMALRKQHQDAFTERYGIKLGFMSFFVRAAIDALQAHPAINAQIHGQDIIYHDYCDVGIAIGGGKGLIVPVLRNAETMTFAQIELAIADFAKRSQTGQLSPEELKGGTFTISNGGVYGSMLSTPIVNPPQSGVLGMHAIQDRPIAKDGQVVIRPMMYLALTYDHRIVDGREAVTFLKRIKDCIENPLRLLLEV